jgi:LPXTG-motif cell wall-anchored protein
MNWFLLIVGLVIAGFGGYLAWFKSKKLIGYPILIVGLLIVVLDFPYLPKWVEPAITGIIYIRPQE